MSERVVITGMGLISSLGLSLDENWMNLVAGKSGVGPISLFDAALLQTRIAAEVPASFETLSREFVKKRASGQMTRVSRMALSAAGLAVNDSGISFSDVNPARCAVILGVVNTGNSTTEKGTTHQNTIFKSMTNAMSAWISMEYKLTGPNFVVNTACASSAYAIALAFDLIRSGQMDIVITGGADSIINAEEISGFNALYALSVANDPPEKASKPFSLDRDGFVIGEGAGMLVLESGSHALSRNSRIYAEIAGYGLTSEGYNIMAPAKDGEGMALTMEKALSHAGVRKSDIGYINAHGTSTELNDRYETMAIKKVFGALAGKIPVSSTKSMTGHTIGAAGAIEAIFTTLSLKNQILPPTINYLVPDPELDLDYIPNKARKAEPRFALSNSFGFGGHNACLVFKKASL
jgi:3-oxoacyl-[acyl-carrier-protein] synthase II